MKSLRIAVANPSDPAGEAIVGSAPLVGVEGLLRCDVSRIYYLSAPDGIVEADAKRLCEELLCDPAIEQYFLGEDLPAEGQALEVATLPGVTDTNARELEKAAAQLGIAPLEVVTATQYVLDGDLSEEDIATLTRRLLANPTIEGVYRPSVPENLRHQTIAGHDFGEEVEVLALSGLDDAGLALLSKERLLSLDVEEMRALQGYFAAAGREPTDTELETFAQTWSEHCCHKTFNAEIELTHTKADGSIEARHYEGLLGLLRQVTKDLNPWWLRSAFEDDAGIVAFDDQFDLAFKVETHNHPSALEPFGGANTGVGGVVRDILGVSARPFACTNVLCFGPTDTSFSALPKGVLHPRRIAQGVVEGIADYGNKLGLPNVNGAVIYGPGYVANPLVYCGALGLLRSGSHPTTPRPGDHVVVIGGRVGRDGIRGATFSSAVLDSESTQTSGAAVQIGDPITEKGCMEVVERASEAGLYNAITDCGAGGLSSAIGEMGRDLGVEIDLANVRLKYLGLAPWEIWLSEAQERMVMAVPLDSLERLSALCSDWSVEYSDLGTLTDSGRLVVRYGEACVVDLDLDFLHKGRPKKKLKATWLDPPLHPPQPRHNTQPHHDTQPLYDTQPHHDPLPLNHTPPRHDPLPLHHTPPRHDPQTLHHPQPRQLRHDPQPRHDTQTIHAKSIGQTLLSLLAHPNVASKQEIIRRYDHEVLSGSVVRALAGVCADGSSDAAVIRPLQTFQVEYAADAMDVINDAAAARPLRTFQQHQRGDDEQPQIASTPQGAPKLKGAPTLAVEAGPAVVVSNGICPSVGKLDPYKMALLAIDEAVRNLVAVGGDPKRVALLDNFCWGNPNNERLLGGLVRAVEGCCEGARRYKMPFISGKDSLYNEFEGKPVASTLLISAVGIVPDFRRAITSAGMQPGDDLWLVGKSAPQLGGSLVDEIYGLGATEVPKPITDPLGRYGAVHGVIMDGLLTAAHDCSEGGVAVALAEMAIGARLGFEVTIPSDGLDSFAAMFNESPGRLILASPPGNRKAVKSALGAWGRLIGKVTTEDKLTFTFSPNDGQAPETISLPDAVAANSAKNLADQVLEPETISLPDAVAAFNLSQASVRSA